MKLCIIWSPIFLKIHIFLLLKPDYCHYFQDRIKEDFSNFSEVQNKKIHWYFPIGVPAKEETIELMTQTLNNDINLMQGAVWGSSKELSLIDEKNQSACLFIK